jgi:hypothetical protein
LAVQGGWVTIPKRTNFPRPISQVKQLSEPISQDLFPKTNFPRPISQETGSDA